MPSEGLGVRGAAWNGTGELLAVGSYDQVRLVHNQNSCYIPLSEGPLQRRSPA